MTLNSRALNYLPVPTGTQQTRPLQPSLSYGLCRNLPFFFTGLCRDRSRPSFHISGITWSGIAATKEKANRSGAERAAGTQRFGTRKNAGGLHELLLPFGGSKSSYNPLADLAAPAESAFVGVFPRPDFLGALRETASWR